MSFRLSTPARLGNPRLEWSKRMRVPPVITLAFIGLAICVGNRPACAQQSTSNDLEINGSFTWGFEYHSNRTTVRIEIDEIRNSSSARTTGTLYVRLFATKSASPFQHGYYFATASLGDQFADNGRLPPNTHFKSVNLVAEYRRPPVVGYYNTFLVISEYPNIDEVVSYRFVKNLVRSPDRTSSAGVLSVNVLQFSERSVEFIIDLFAMDSNSNLISLRADHVDILPRVDGNGTLYEFELVAMERLDQLPIGPYSATFVLDQSGSILRTDPGDLRISAAEAFMDHLTSGDEVGLMAFATDGKLPYRITRYNGFKSARDSDGFDATLRTLAQREGGRTPLFDAVRSGIQYTVDNEVNSNRAVLLFTDGEDNDSRWDLDDVIDFANLHDVSVHVMALSREADTETLSRLAQSTGGSMAFASEAEQLMSYYGGLGNYLSGRGGFYRTRWKLTLSGGLGRLSSGFAWVRTIAIVWSGGLIRFPFRLDLGVDGSVARGLPPVSGGRQQVVTWNVSLGAFGGQVTLTQTDDGWWLGESPVENGRVVRGENGLDYALRHVDGGWIAEYIGRVDTVALGESGSFVRIYQAEDGLFSTHDGPIRSGDTIQAENGDHFALLLADGSWSAIRLDYGVQPEVSGAVSPNGDGGPATRARLYIRSGPLLAGDAFGSFYIAEPSNSRVRRVDATGTITTFAGTGKKGYGGDGGPAYQALLNWPTGVAMDGIGNVYIADSGNYRVRKVDPDGTITTFAGTG